MPRLVHMADTHLGHRRFERITKAGLNQREADVAGTFARTIDRIIELRPDIIVHGGDVFDAPKPPNAAIVHAFAQFQRLRTALPNTPVVMVAGNHDRGRTSDTGCILALFRQIGCHAAIAAPQRFTFGDMSVLAVPELASVPELTPDDAKYRVLLLHGEIAGVIKSEQKGQQIPVEALKAPAWTYIALGHFHVMHEVAPNACYSGATEYTSSDVWSETRDEAERGVPGKGFLEVDLETGNRTFHPVAVSRRWVDIAPIDAAGRGADELTAAILSAIEDVPDGIDNAVARVTVTNCPPEVRRSLDHAGIRKAKLRAFNLRLDIRRPEKEAEPGYVPLPRRGASVGEMLEWALEKRELAADIDRAELVKLGKHYLDRATDEAEPQREETDAAA